MASVHDLDIALEMADCVVVTTDHSVYDWAYIAKRADLLVDTRHVVDSARIGSTPSDFITQTAAPHPETVLEKT